MLTQVSRLRSAAGHFSRRFTVNQVSSLTGTLGLVFILATASFIVWNERRTLMQEGRDHAERSANFLADHAQRLFEVADIALRSTQTAVTDRTWASVEGSDEIKATMRSIDSLLPYVSSIVLADETGRIRLTTLSDATKIYSLADRSIFQEARHAGDTLLVSDPLIGRVSHKPTFLVARRLDSPDGSFRGVVAVAMSLDYFTEYWMRFEFRNDERIALVRSGDGGVLARYPAEGDGADLQRIGTITAAAVRAEPKADEIAPGPHEFGFYHQVGNLPISVAVVFRDAAINAAWTAWILRFAPFVILASLALGGITVLGRRLARREGRNRVEIETARRLLAASNSRLEQRVAERTAELQESNQEIQRFAYIVSHDLRAPLVNIMGFTSELQGLREQLFGERTEDRGGVAVATATQLRADFDEAIGFIESSIDKMDRLIKAILTLSRQGQRRFRPEPLDMDVIMRGIADGVAHRLQQAGAALTIEPLPPIVADRIAIEQVFSNILDNAVKYLQPGRPGQIEIGGRGSATTVTFEIKDNGRGIDPKDRERVFELFRRAGAQDQPGEGIGLANVRSLVRRLQGTIALDSMVELGSVFTITLPKVGSESGNEAA